MKITLKRINGKHIVMVNGHKFAYNTLHDALQFVSCVRGGLVNG